MSEGMNGLSRAESQGSGPPTSNLYSLLATFPEKESGGHPASPCSPADLCRGLVSVLILQLSHSCCFFFKGF